MPRTTPPAADDGAYPDWFAQFLADRAIRKLSPHSAKAYRQDFTAIAMLIGGDGVAMADLPLNSVTKDAVRQAFATYADTHEPASIRRCWSTWNTLCSFLYTSELIPANPMPLIGRPKVAKALPKALRAETVVDLLAVIDIDEESRRRTDWAERDRALILTSLLAGLRADELLRANVGDIRTTDEGGVIHVCGKGGTDRRIPIEQKLIEVFDTYLDSRAIRFPGGRKRRTAARGLAAWVATAPLFVGSDGERITRGTLQYRVLRAFRKAGLDGQRARGALVHGLRHTYATELANADISVYTLMKLLGHESMTTSQRYVSGAGTENRAAAAQNPLYQLIATPNK
ncbi:Tyrosine recombinase XerD [Mycobacterium marinum]|uniref:tyrosine-type recombinase/integrase n=1 Tax=Mycobacterium marinum TaxID=1781 RepID=UPI000E3DBE03|nr:tyrosine-type recombinase/integrase [Mycobacterium marinum]RFZ12625.1 Tyrosine recombinase XerD [Mycobacterium marinum]